MIANGQRVVLKQHIITNGDDTTLDGAPVYPVSQIHAKMEDTETMRKIAGNESRSLVATTYIWFHQGKMTEVLLEVKDRQIQRYDGFKGLIYVEQSARRFGPSSVQHDGRIRVSPVA